MKIKFNSKYKSITNLDEIDLPDFVVLTGVNGAGKSHLLEAIENGSISVEGAPKTMPPSSPSIRRFDSNTLVPQDSGAFSVAQIVQEQTNFLQEIKNYSEQNLNGIKGNLHQFSIPGLNALSVQELLALREDDLLRLGLEPAKTNYALQVIQDAVKYAETNVKNNFIQNDPINRTKFIEKFDIFSDQSIFSINDDDFYKKFPLTWQSVDLFQQSFARLFSGYRRLWAKNQLMIHAKSTGHDVEFLSDDDFLIKFGMAPWDFLNEILDSAELDFRINEPPKWDDRPYEPILIDSKRDVQIKFKDLSSGERILMSFALCLYHANDPNTTADFPKVILFDEIDAPLHPSMTRSLLRTIQQTLVNKHQIKVILTTHSPSTVALAPEDSIYVMSKQGANRLRKSTKDEALGILTAGVPILSVNYENRRQVFVESANDIGYYSSLYELSKPSLHPDISLSFIAAGTSHYGGCDQVKSLVNQLNKEGNKTVVGIIDWDAKNESAGSIWVLGECERYSIENFILDPVLVGLFLLRQMHVKSEGIGLCSDVKYSEARSFTQEQFQLIANSIIDLFDSPEDGVDIDEVVKFKYINEFSVDVPKWFSVLKGHDLESQLKNKFPPLKKYSHEDALKSTVIGFVLNDYPLFMPLSIVELFKAIQKMGKDST